MKISINNGKNNQRNIVEGIDLNLLYPEVKLEYAKSFMRKYLFGLFINIDRFEYQKVINAIVDTVHLEVYIRDLKNIHVRNVLSYSIYSQVRMVLEEIYDLYEGLDFTITESDMDSLVEDIYEIFYK